MSTNRSSSAVRDLRAMFENQEANTEARAASPNGRVSLGNGDQKTSKIRASFVPVEKGDSTPTNGAIEPSATSSPSSHPETTDVPQPQLSEDSGAGARGPDDNGTEDTTQATTSMQVAESAAQSAKGIEPEKESSVQHSPNGVKNAESITLSTSTRDIPAMNPDKPVSAAEEEPGPLKPADPTGMNNVTSTSPSQLKTITKRASKVSLPAKGKTSDASITSPMAKSVDHGTPSKTPSKARTPTSKQSIGALDIKSSTPAGSKLTSPKSPRRPTTSGSKTSEASNNSATVSKPSARPPRSSLTAQTASSAARSRTTTAEPPHSPATKTTAPKSKPRSPTKPAKLSSHLTAPTAASAAKHDNVKPAAKSVASSASTRASTGDTKAPVRGVKTGLGRSNSTVTRPTPRNSNMKPTGSGPDEGFLARMTRPTASSSSKAHEKAESKTVSQKTNLPFRPRTSGSDGKAKASAKVDRNVAHDVEGSKEGKANDG